MATAWGMGAFLWKLFGQPIVFSHFDAPSSPPFPTVIRHPTRRTREEGCDKAALKAVRLSRMSPSMAADEGVYGPSPQIEGTSMKIKLTSVYVDDQEKARCHIRSAGL